MLAWVVPVAGKAPSLVNQEHHALPTGAKLLVAPVPAQRGEGGEFKASEFVEDLEAARLQGSVGKATIDAKGEPKFAGGLHPAAESGRFYVAVSEGPGGKMDVGVCQGELIKLDAAWQVQSADAETVKLLRPLFDKVYAAPRTGPVLPTPTPFSAKLESERIAESLPLPKEATPTPAPVVLPVVVRPSPTPTATPPPTPVPLPVQPVQRGWWDNDLFRAIGFLALATGSVCAGVLWRMNRRLRVTVGLLTEEVYSLRRYIDESR